MALLVAALGGDTADGESVLFEPYDENTSTWGALASLIKHGTARERSAFVTCAADGDTPGARRILAACQARESAGEAGVRDAGVIDRLVAARARVRVWKGSIGSAFVSLDAPALRDVQQACVKDASLAQDLLAFSAVRAGARFPAGPRRVCTIDIPGTVDAEVRPTIHLETFSAGFGPSEGGAAAEDVHQLARRALALAGYPDLNIVLYFKSESTLDVNGLSLLRAEPVSRRIVEEKLRDTPSFDELPRGKFRANSDTIVAVTWSHEAMVMVSGLVGTQFAPSARAATVSADEGSILELRDPYAVALASGFTPEGAARVTSEVAAMSTHGEASIVGTIVHLLALTPHSDVAAAMASIGLDTSDVHVRDLIDQARACVLAPDEVSFDVLLPAVLDLLAPAGLPEFRAVARGDTRRVEWVGEYTKKFRSVEVARLSPEEARIAVDCSRRKVKSHTKHSHFPVVFGYKRLYHGTTLQAAVCVADRIAPPNSKDLDFGPGFYTTPYYDLAVHHAIKRTTHALRTRAPGAVSAAAVVAFDIPDRDFARLFQGDGKMCAFFFTTDPVDKTSERYKEWAETIAHFRAPGDDDDFPDNPPSGGYASVIQGPILQNPEALTTKPLSLAELRPIAFPRWDQQVVFKGGREKALLKFLARIVLIDIESATSGEYEAGGAASGGGRVGRE